MPAAACVCSWRRAVEARGGVTRARCAVTCRWWCSDLSLVCSYLSLVEAVHHDCNARSMRLAAILAREDPADSVRYQPVTYGPVVPPECSAAYKASVLELYRLHSPPQPELPTLLAGQLPKHGGDAAKPPPGPGSKPPAHVQVPSPCCAPAACGLVCNAHHMHAPHARIAELGAWNGRPCRPVENSTVAAARCTAVKPALSCNRKHMLMISSRSLVACLTQLRQCLVAG